MDLLIVFRNYVAMLPGVLYLTEGGMLNVVLHAYAIDQS
jgi:hypothetical protein